MSKDYSKDEKTLYFPKSEPTLVTIPKMVFFMIEGAGNPNDNSAFKSHIEVLYQLSYAVKMMPAKHPAPNGYYE